MQELTLGTLLAVFEEVFGATLFWLMVAAALLITLGYFYVLVRDRTVSWKKFLIAQLSMPIGAVLSVWFVMLVTDSSLSDVRSPVDLIVVFGIALFGAIGMAILVYTLESLIRTRRTRSETTP
jgi:tellurite resistance protein TehA-like permease